MSYSTLCRSCSLATLVFAGCLVPCGSFAEEQAQSAMLGTMKADRILFLGNSLTLHGRHEPYGWLHNCGMAASVPEKDFVHVLTAALEARTGGHLRLSITETKDGPAGTEPANIVNVAGTLERSYTKYSNAPLQKQLDWKPDIVVLQCGENVVRDKFEPAPFKEALRSLLNALQAAGSPQIFVTSQILSPGGALDDLKNEVCAEDPSHRTYVDLSSFCKDPTNYARSEPYYTGIITGHPGDKGMARIASTLLEAMLIRAGLSKTTTPTAAP